MSLLRKLFGKSRNGDDGGKKSGRQCRRSCCRSSVSTDGSAGSSPPINPVMHNNFARRSNKDRPLVPGKSYMPVSKNNPNYNMEHPRRGKALIFNFDRWDNTNIPHLEESPRHGSQKDKRDLAKCLRGMDFQVEEYDNLKFKDMHDVLEDVRFDDHTDADCLVIAVMTHGERNTVYCGDGIQIPVNIIWEYFEANNCPTLAGKPKIFIIQACRGKQYDSGTTLHTPKLKEVAFSQTSDVTDSGNFSYVIPNAADIIVAFSCPIGHYSWRHPERGSWFIQSICKVFKDHCYSMELQTLFTTVAREVALNYESSTTNIESNNKKQVTSTSSTLIRTVQFKPKQNVATSAFPSSSDNDHRNGHGGPIPIPPEVLMVSADLINNAAKLGIDSVCLRSEAVGSSDLGTAEIAIVVAQETPVLLTNDTE